MLYNIRQFLKTHVHRGSFLWNSLLLILRGLEKLQRVKSSARRITLPFTRIHNLNHYESKINSQNGEDGILQAIFCKIGVTNTFCVEFGVEDGTERNTRYLCEKQGWTSLLLDPAENNPAFIKREFITVQNINDVFKKYDVPHHFDLLSIDIDGNDYWVWKALAPCYSPSVVVMEYNAKIPPTDSKTIAYEPDFSWDGTDYFGASLLALVRLACEKGYTLVGCESKGVNAFFVRNDKIEGNFVVHDIRELYKPPRYGKKEDGGGWPSSRRTMIAV